MKPRFHDAEQSIYDFADIFLVVCPRCSRCATVAPREPEQAQWLAPRRLVCEHCGLAKDWDGKRIDTCTAADWYFGLPLWLQTPCCGEVLWAHNSEHLDFLESFVEAELREVASHGTLASRLPGWMKSAKNR